MRRDQPRTEHEKSMLESARWRQFASDVKELQDEQLFIIEGRAVYIRPVAAGEVASK